MCHSQIGSFYVPLPTCFPFIPFTMHHSRPVFHYLSLITYLPLCVTHKLSTTMCALRASGDSERRPANNFDGLTHLPSKALRASGDSERRPANNFDGLTHLPSKAHYGRLATANEGRPTTSTDLRTYLLRSRTDLRTYLLRRSSGDSERRPANNFDGLTHLPSKAHYGRALRASGDSERRPANNFDGLTHLPSKAHYGRLATANEGRPTTSTDLRTYLLRRITGVWRQRTKAGQQLRRTYALTKGALRASGGLTRTGVWRQRTANNFDGLTHLPSKAHYGRLATANEGRPTTSTDLRTYLLRRITGVNDSERRPANNFDGLTHLPSKAHYGRLATANEGRPTTSTDLRTYLLRRITGVWRQRTKAGQQLRRTYALTSKAHYGPNEGRPTTSTDLRTYLLRRITGVWRQRTKAGQQLRRTYLLRRITGVWRQANEGRPTTSTDALRASSGDSERRPANNFDGLTHLPSKAHYGRLATANEGRHYGRLLSGRLTANEGRPTTSTDGLRASGDSERRPANNFDGLTHLPSKAHYGRALRASGDSERRPANNFDGLTHLPSKAHYGRLATTNEDGLTANITGVGDGTKAGQQLLTHLPSKAHYGRLKAGQQLFLLRRITGVWRQRTKAGQTDLRNALRASGDRNEGLRRT
ncbi:unnamed protein product [Acanthosepion pharaonis]|uniref:Uncharacterized protein n=1 Tax=Acanthosepion pharaonis TaxID=158019 RepID=A0A812DME2_ACAPH|nr:unnamed protein product [Sepia pharaonis]